MRHLLTVDVEASFRGARTGRSGPASDPELPAAMERLLDLLDAVNARATFFVLGEDAEELTGALSRCVKAGHEVACHGMRHARVASLSPEEFRNDLRQAISRITDVAQVACRGYRAPWFSAPAGKDWFFEILGEEGIVYDASLRIPVETRLAGTSRGGILLMPVPLLKFGAARIGAVGGLALRVFPKAVISRMVRRCETYDQPACLYLHPYEWTTRRPAAAAPSGLSLSALRRGLLTSRTLPRVKWLSGHVEWGSVAQWLGI